jgi:hypothetical protein
MVLWLIDGGMWDFSNREKINANYVLRIEETKSL